MSIGIPTIIAVTLRAAGLYFGGRLPSRTGSGFTGSCVDTGVGVGVGFAWDGGGAATGDRYGRGFGGVEGFIGLEGRGIIVVRGGEGFESIAGGVLVDFEIEDVAVVGCEIFSARTAAAGIVAAPPPAALNVPFAVTSCIILLLDGDAGVVLAGFSALFASTFLLVAFVLFIALFATFFTASSSPFVAFAALVEAFLVPAFFTSSTTSSTTFFGRPRPRLGTTSAAEDIRSVLVRSIGV
jgi:hypothetical protein